ncbi:hypothetical protein [Marinomonas sp. TW1]|uniref:hypothetical protein n=1 Tax=Marinomonas sp. TW1 TaxID=1561203 RepID=UPI0007AF765F|nr:hypothetical protein [Marinomonas sp. TW1]KZN15031.1 hypothetical protein OA79_02165 [Marinomonas sp. TW1]
MHKNHKHSHQEIAQQAIDLVRPAIDELFKRSIRSELHIVILDPRLKPWEGDFDEAILYQESIKSGAPWEKPFDDFARNKAKQAWRAQRHNLHLQVQHPSSLKDDDLPFYGAFVYGDLVVACSGVEQWFDMLVSSWVAMSFEQLMIHQQHQA